MGKLKRRWVRNKTFRCGKNTGIQETFPFQPVLAKRKLVPGKKTGVAEKVEKIDLT